MNIEIYDPRSRLSSLTDKIVDSYRTNTRTHHLDHCPLPNRKAVVDAIHDLLEIVYPGYRSRDRRNMENATYHVGNLVNRLLDSMTIQISRAFCHGTRSADVCTPDKKESFLKLGEEKAVSFLEQIPVIREMLAKDVEAAYVGDPACRSYDEVIFCYPGLLAITIYRLAHALDRLEIPLIPRMMTEWAHGQTGIDIHPKAEIGDHFFIDHGTGVVIGETCEIGNWVKIYQGVTLGALSFPKDDSGQLVRGKKRHPTLDDNVVIYANATVLGGETRIGRNATIGSNVWLVYSVAPNTTVTIEKPNLVVK